ncbi:phage neck terminator protein [Avibacterium avium]|uniref:phage neck terminator protein n=1 Tax=Avibacterium avium TaxID=751 RepID=UPI003BF84C56
MLDVLYDLLSTLSDRPFIRAYENGREPERPFFTYELRFEQTPTHFHYSKLNDQGNQQVKTHVDATLELNYFGEDSLNALRSLCMKLSTVTQRNRWNEQGVALVRIGRITHLAYLNEQQEYQDRAMVEIEIRYAVAVEDMLSIIEQVEVASQVGDLSDITQIGVKNNGKN